MNVAVSLRVNRYLHFKVNSKGKSSMEKSKDTECSFLKREVDIKGNGKTIRCMVLGSCFIMVIR